MMLEAILSGIGWAFVIGTGAGGLIAVVRGFL